MKTYVIKYINKGEERETEVEASSPKYARVRFNEIYSRLCEVVSIKEKK